MKPALRQIGGINPSISRDAGMLEWARGHLVPSDLIYFGIRLSIPSYQKG